MIGALRMTKRDRMRRIVLLCCHFARNFAYYRTGWAGMCLVTPDTEFWRTVNGNCLDQCVLEWCKLFGDGKGEHYWGRIVSDASGFKAGLLRHLDVQAVAFESIVAEMRFYRDKFVAHLDYEKVMLIPKLDVAKASVLFYFTYLVNNEVVAGDLVGLPNTVGAFKGYYEQCANEAAKVYSGTVSLDQRSQT